jgi:hypothetical protein
MSIPVRPFVRGTQQDSTVPLSIGLFVHRSPVLDAWSRIMQPGAVECVIPIVVIFAERFSRLLTAGAMVMGHA